MSQMQIRGNTQIMAGTIYDAQIAALAAIATSKLADGANFIKRDGSVAFTGNVNMGGFRITSVGEPSSAQDVATKNYVDTFANGFTVKGPVRVVATSNITLSGTQTIDGVALTVGDRVAPVGQTTASQNGIYTVQSGAWFRATDADTSAEVKGGMTFWVDEGTQYGNSQWVLTSDNPITLGTTNLTFVRLSGLGQVIAGAGLTQTGNTIDVAGGNGLNVSADSVSVKLAADWGLEFDGVGGLKLKMPASAGLNTDESGLYVNAGNGLEVNSNAVRIKLPTDSGLSASGTGLTVLLASNAGLKLTGGLAIKLDSSSNLVVGAGGVKVSATPTFTNVSVTDGQDTGTITPVGGGSPGISVAGMIQITGSGVAPYLEFAKAGMLGQLVVAALSGGQNWTLPNNSGVIPVAGAAPISISATGVISLDTGSTGVLKKSDFARGEIPSGTINGSNVTFTLSSAPQGEVMLFYNGQRLRSGVGNDFTMSGATITMTFAPTGSDVLMCDYLK